MAHTRLKKGFLRIGRFLIGFLIGLWLTAQATVFAGAGFGTDTPLYFTASIVMLILGRHLTFFAAPILWAAYFLLLPMSSKPKTRVIALLTIVALHLFSGLVAAARDAEFARALSGDKLGLAVGGTLWLIAIAILVFLAMRGESVRD